MNGSEEDIAIFKIDIASANSTHQSLEMSNELISRDHTPANHFFFFVADNAGKMY